MARRCLCRCRHCRIFFLGDPRNARREDLGCPFGCREAHRKRESTRRSVDYYRTPEGKIKKRQHNSRRNRTTERRTEPVDLDSSDPANQEHRSETQTDGDAKMPAPPRRWAAPLLEYVRVICRLIDGRWFTVDEVLEMLREVWRQRSMVRWRKVDHLIAYLNRGPP